MFVISWARSGIYYRIVQMLKEMDPFANCARTHHTSRSK